MKTRKALFLVTIMVAAMGLLTGCGQGAVQEGEGGAQNEESASPKGKEGEGNPMVQVEMEAGGKFVLELYPEYAPKTVDNFVNLVKKGFYDGLTFHRIVDGFMAQGGDPDGNGTGGSDEEIKGEFAANGFEQNSLKHTKGVISMARSQDMDSASSQFFIMLADVPSLDGSYAAFGKVIEGMDVVEAFQEVEREMNQMGEVATPVQPVVMKKLTLVEASEE